MDASTFTQSGNYTALAGLVVIIVAHFGGNTDVPTILTVIGGVVALIGIAKQMYTHSALKNQALVAGAIK